ncbi:MAG TPA: hypothetical protein VGX03_28820 [Candidatus Binatia bacterium]|nr:hypothetical protein [Candidatus Binatia bacterium]
MAKYPQRQFAGGLPYFTHGFAAEVGGAILPSTVTLTTARLRFGVNTNSLGLGGKR